MKVSRKPKYRGSGMYVHFITFNDLVDGDYFCDVDYGLMMWVNGKWRQVEGCILQLVLRLAQND